MCNGFDRNVIAAGKGHGGSRERRICASVSTLHKLLDFVERSGTNGRMIESGRLYMIKTRFAAF